ncbi:MAG TPA: amidohydrolase [Blastocatellia bacterium]|nr:amidohydrolase [Blastocatellia bacterium]
MKIIDTHQHLWDPEQFSYSWTKNIPALNRSFRMEDYLAAASGVEIDCTVHLEADVDEPYMRAETRWILSLAEREDNPLEGVVACARPEYAGFEDYLRDIAHPKLKGIRRVLHVVPDTVSEAPGFVENLRLLEKYNLSFDLCVLARQLPIAIRLARECPNVQFILDHCGNPLIREKVPEPWRSYISELATCPNVVCKISGIVTNADPQHWTAEDLRPYVSHVIESFGWERVMFGSDWPVCTLAASFQQWVEALTLLTREAGEENQRKLFWLNAKRVYKLG